MKKLSSLFSLFSSFKYSKTYHPFSLALIAVAIVTSYSCRQRVGVSESVSSQTALATVKDEIEPGWIPMKDSGAAMTSVVAWLGARSCIQSNVEMKARFSAGLYTTDVLLHQSWGSSQVSAEVDGIKMVVEGGMLDQSMKEQICAAIQAHGNTLTIPTDLSSKFKSAVELTLASVAPDCRSIDMSPEGWQCSLTSLMPQSAIIMIEDFQQAMIRKWSRQPYVLARRAGVTMSLARAAVNLTNEVNIQKFCKVLQFSLPEELPLVMTSSRWQKSLCDGNDSHRREAAFHGLAKAVEELSMIRQLYENTSKVGTFSINIPNADIPGRTAIGLQPLLVTITPDQEVTDRLIDVAESILGRPRIDSKRSNRRTAALKPEVLPTPLVHRKPHCWHPMFSDSAALMRVADGMRLTGDGFKGECKSEAPVHADAGDPLARYLTQSLTSETEFVMDNGQSKLLRLPEGSYQYTVQVLPQNPVDAEDQIEEPLASSKGELLWGLTRGHFIRNWQ